MKTEILTSEFLKLIDPFKDAISYRGTKVNLKMKELKKYVENPKDNEVLNTTGDFEKDLYKDLALYIINSNDSRLINIDLNNPEIFEHGKGLFEYIKNIYNGEKKSYINLNETADNLILIQEQELKPLDNELNIEIAEDIRYATAASALSSDPKKAKGQVTWKQLNSDRYGDLNYVMGKVREVFTKGTSSSYNKDNNFNTLFGILFEKINPDLANSDEFKLAMLDLRLTSLNEFFIQRYNKYLLKNDSDVSEIDELSENEKSEQYFIDFSQPVYQEKIFSQIENHDFTLIEDLFSSYLENKVGYARTKENFEISKKLLKTIDFKSFLNQPEITAYLLQQNFTSESSFKDAINQFTMVSVYPFFPKEKRLQKEIVEKCIKLASSNRSGDLSLDEDIIFTLDSETFKEPYVLAPIIQCIEANKFLRQINKDNYPILKDKEFIAQSLKKTYAWKIKDWLYGLFDKKELDKEFIKSVITHAPQFFEILDEGKARDLAHFSQDPDIIFAAINNGLSPKRLSGKTMRVLLLEDHDKDFESVKIKYLISTEAIDDLGRSLGVQGEELAKVKAKYHRPEYLFYSKDAWRINLATRERALSKLKTPEEILSVLDKVAENNFKYEFLADLFYRSMDESLKKNKIIVNRILDLGKIKYSNLHPAVGYNAEIALKCLEKDSSNLSSIPDELFTNSKFALGFARMMDRRDFKTNEIPSFVTKFFENQEITSKFEEHLKEHLFYTDLQADLDKPQEPISKVRKAKI